MLVAVVDATCCGANVLAVEDATSETNDVALVLDTVCDAAATDDIAEAQTKAPLLS